MSLLLNAVVRISSLKMSKQVTLLFLSLVKVIKKLSFVSSSLWGEKGSSFFIQIEKSPFAEPATIPLVND